MDSDSSRRFFKGWARPGPLVERTEEPGPEETLDALAGDFRIFQLRDGHRFSTDDLLVAWYGTISAPRAGRVLDLGSGIGSVGMTAAWRLPGASFVTVEAQEQSVALARRSARYNGLESRYEIRQGDFRSPVLRPDEKFELVLGSPPYFPLDTGVHGDHPQKVACRFEVRGDIGDYCRVAAAHLDWGGLFACVFPIEPAHQKARVFAAAKAVGLTVIRWRPVVLKQGEPPLLGVFAMQLSEHLPEAFRAASPFEESPLTIRRADGSVDPEYRVVKISIGFPP